MKKTLFFVGVLVIIVGFLWQVGLRMKDNDDVVENGNTEEPLKDFLNYKDLVILESPLPEEIVTSPLVIKGQARGTWFFEASFPVILADWDGRIIAQGIATATDDWMTEELVPFTASLEFENPENIGDFSRRGALILKKDNPSGLPEHDDALEITVYFK